jgi:hypothetical protein
MGLTKIALGVFLGVIAAFLAIKAPGWIEQSQREARYRDADHIMYHMTPDLAIQRCGKPLKDVFDRKSSTRKMYFDGPQANTLAVLQFWKDDNGEWSFQYMTRGYVFKKQLEDGDLVQDKDDHGAKSSYLEVLNLPCLEGKKR